MNLVAVNQNAVIFASQTKYMESSIIEKALQIKLRKGKSHSNYGPPVTSMKRAAQIATLICGKEITAQDVCKIQIALKLSREAHSHKEDNLVDLVGYASILNDISE